MEHYLNLTVSDPIKREGVMSYTTYKVNTMTNRPDLGGSSFSVIRRFTHFKDLHRQLADEFPGAVVPPLPEKRGLGRFEDEFVEARRRNLERFLERVALHPELKASAHLVRFLTADEAELGGEPEDGAGGEDGAPAAKGKGLMSWVKKTVNKATALSTQLGATPHVNPTQTPEDLRFEELSEYIKGLEIQLDNVATHARALKERNAELGKGLFDFGLSFSLLGEAEKSELGAALTSMGRVADELGRTSTELSQREALQFEDPLSDYVRIVGAVRAALTKRSEYRALVGIAQTEVAGKEAALARVRGVPGKEDRVGAAESAVALAHQALDKAEREFAEVTSRVIREVEKFKHDKADDMRRISLDYVRLQIEFNQKVRLTVTLRP